VRLDQQAVHGRSHVALERDLHRDAKLEPGVDGRRKELAAGLDANVHDARAALPEPVRRYLRLALQEGQPRFASVRLEQSGRLRTGVESEQWLDFTAAETIAPEVRGFVWDARMRLAPLVHASIRDAYVGGVADARVALQSAVTMAADHGSHERN
jgi:hypothetical protein